MAGALVGSPATYILALLIAASVGLNRLGHKVWRMGPMGLTGLVMYVVSTAIVTSYRYVPGDVQVGWWTVCLLVVGLLYIGVLMVRGVRIEIPAMFAAWIVLAFGGALAAETDLMRKLYWVLQYAGIATLAVVCYLRVARDDLMGQLVWGVLFMAEWISAFQIVDCQFLHGMAGAEIVEGSACTQVYGWAGAGYLPTALPTLILAWILFRWFKPRSR